ncbi:hypothetical protein EI546_00280 [Aequorivita sp. H23M31]|uniref:TIGR02588 family protein n=1 Tax=Aequorivita ciconiae TaxID=2494375 RepID=A0A451FSA0_9FLAO|nr:hypothetical protein [Aequorivita sp. H23M31]QAA80263.1 hypothetical protein EI546_00280 [Aequorivita sp. H23M31]
MKDKSENTNWLERIVTVIAGILVLFTFGFLIYQIIYRENTPPDLVISLGEITQKQQGYSIPVSVKNNGTQTAENINIEISSGEGDNQETGQLSFQYIPGKSSNKAWVNFTKKPDPNKIKTHVSGYSTP